MRGTGMSFTGESKAIESLMKMAWTFVTDRYMLINLLYTCSSLHRESCS